MAGNAVTDCISKGRYIATAEGTLGKWYRVKGALGNEVNITLPLTVTYIFKREYP
jgi:hypothetical protein